jgi:hypothetical protein
VPPYAVTVVINQEFSAAFFQHPKNVDECRHARILVERTGDMES